MVEAGAHLGLGSDGVIHSGSGARWRRRFRRLLPPLGEAASDAHGRLGAPPLFPRRCICHTDAALP
jgi:hypothetical protein